jgi:hypothetical protein
MHKYYISFADDKFLGAVFIEAPCFQLAPFMAALFGVNPGGEAMIVDLPDRAEIPAKWMNKLMSKEDIKAFDREMLGDKATEPLGPLSYDEFVARLDKRRRAN